MLVGSWAGDSEGWKKATRFFLKSSWTICVKPWVRVLWHMITSKYNWKNFEKLYDKLLTVNTSRAMASSRVSVITEMSHFCTVQYRSHGPPVTAALCSAAQSCPALCDPVLGLQPARLLCPWGISNQEPWSGMSCPPPGDLPNPGIEPRSPA